MPQLNENKYPQADLIADINAGTSFVKVKPERIGDLIYFDSTLPQAEPQDAAVVVRKRKKTLLYGLGVLIVIWAFFLLVFPGGVVLALHPVMCGFDCRAGDSFPDGFYRVRLFRGD